MKKILLLTVFIFTSNIYGQTIEERKKIVENYDKIEINNLKQALIEKNNINKKAVDDFVARTGIDRVIKLENGGVMELMMIIDGKPIYYTTDNVNSAKATRTDFLHNGGALGLNLEGQNMHVATWDGGPTLASHQEFEDYQAIPSSRVDNPDLSASNDQSNHSTHVSGTIIAKGINAPAKGMAPRATLTSFDWDFDDVEALNEASTNGLLLSNHSYGVPMQTAASLNWMMGCYNTEARTWDEVAYSAPYYLSVVSAGNNGSDTYNGGLANNYDKLVGNKNSKNNLVVANANDPLIHPNGSGDLLNLFINVGSSQGPSDDGRIKPDISADGTNVFSPISTSDQAYSVYSGTSMSAPNTTGTLLLLQQYYNQLNTKYMRAATLKGLACHTADDDFSSPGPDPIFGWGLLNAKTAAETIEKDSNGQALISELSLANGETYSFTFGASGTEPLSATLCWTDPAGFDQSGSLNSPTPALVNDLDLRLTDSNSSISLPWKLQLSNVAGLATTGDNTVDTVENIDIAAPVAGVYTLTVTHKGSLTNSNQAFSLIVTGSDLTLSTQESSISEFFMWPNPANDILNFKFNSLNNTNVNVSLVDIQGREVYSNIINSNNSTINSSINTSSFSKGVYILNIKQGNAHINKKVIVK